MADRRMEFMEKVKFALDKSEARRDAEEFAKELQGILGDTKIGFDANSLKELGELFNKKLKELGKNPIIFSDIKFDNNALKEITTRFTNAIAEGIQAGIKKGFDTKSIGSEIEKQIKELNEKKQGLLQRQKDLKKSTYGTRKSVDKINAYNPTAEDNRFTLKGDVFEHAREYLQQYNDAVNKMNSISNKTSKEYTQAVIDAQKALDNVSYIGEHMKKLQKQSDKAAVEAKEKMLKNLEKGILSDKESKVEKFEIPKDLKRAYGFGNGGQFDSVMWSESADTIREEYEKITSANIELKQVTSEIAKIDKELEGLEKKRLKIIEEINKAEASNSTIKKKQLTDEGIKSVEKERKTRLTDSYAKQHRENIDIGSTVESAAMINLQTGDIKEFHVANTPHRSDLKFNKFDNTKPFTGEQLSEPIWASIHSHASREAAPSIAINENEYGDLDTFANVASTHPKHIIKAMEEELWLDFSKLKKNELQTLLSNWRRNAEEVLNKWYQTPESQRDGEWFESYQSDLKATFLKTIEGLPDGFATYVKNPMFEGQTSTVDLGLNKAKRSSIFKPEDIIDANDVETLKQYADEYKKLSKLGGNLSTSDKTVRELLYNQLVGRFGDTDESYAVSDMLFENKDSQVIAEAIMSQIEAINQATVAQQKLNDVRKESVNFDDVGISEEIKQETGTLEDKLDRLQDLSDQWGQKISQKKRDRYEELNQKDIDSGLTTAEDNRMSELYEEISQADEALEEFGQTYEKIVLKLANGKKVEIFPDDKGLSTLYKVGDEYGESYNGIEIEDVVFERIKKEIAAQEQLNDAKREEQQLEQADTSSAQVAEDNTETVAIEKQNEALKENISLKQMVENASGTHGQSLASASGAIGNGDTGVGIDTQTLQNILNATYNVKIVNDDADKTSNKIAIDESALETTLTRVFANIINPSTEQNDGNVQEPWALESTLQAVNSVLDTIQTNTSKIGTSEAITVADDGVLSAIKTAVESINKKIIQGTKVIETGDKKSGTSKTKEPQTSNTDKKREEEINKVGDMYEKLGKLQAEINKSDSEAIAQELVDLQKIIDAEQERLKLTEEQIKKLKERRDVALEKDSLKQADQQRKQAEKNEKATLRAEMKDIRDKSRLAKANSTWRSGKDVHGLTMNMVDEANGISIDNVINHPDVAKLHKELSDLTVIQEKVNYQIQTNQKVSDEDTIALQKQTAATQQQISVVKDLQKNYEFFSGDNSKTLNQTYTGGDLETQLKQAIMLATNGKAKFHEYNATLGQWTYSVAGANNETKNYTAGLRGLDNQLRTVHTSTKKTESLFESIKRKTKEVFTYFSGSSMVYKLFGEVRKGIQYIREIDSALTELKKVTDETEETYDKFLDTAAKTADKVGSTIKDVVSSTADFARLGYSLKEAAVFAESAQILMNVSEFTDISRATDTLISAVQAFGYTAETSMDVVDLLNMIGNNYAISTADLAQSLTKSSASLVAAGGNLAEAAALTATANKIIQDADSVGK